MKTPFFIIILFFIVCVFYWILRMLFKGGCVILGGIIFIILFLLKIVLLTFIFCLVVGVVMGLCYLILYRFGQPWEGVALFLGMIGGFYLYSKLAPYIDKLLEN